MRNRRFLNLLPLTLWALASMLASPARAYVTDGASHPPPQYNSFVPPGKGASYTDPVFGTSVKRLTTALSTPNNADGGLLTWAMNEYSSMSPFNQGATRFLLQHDSYFALYDQAGNYLRDLPFEINASSEPRWSRTDPSVLYYVMGNQLRRFNVSTNAIAVQHAFNEYSSITGNGESDICFDGNHMVLAGDGREIFVYEIGTDTKGAVLDTGGRGFDSIYMTPDDTVSVTWYEHGSSRYNGIELYSRDMQFLRQLTHAGGHMDYTRDNTGAAVLIWTNAADSQPIPGCDNGIVKVRLSDGQQTCLQELDWNLAVHISAPDAAGFAIVSTYAPGDPDPNGVWPAYTNEILQVMFDGSPTRRYAHHRSRPHNGYNYTTRATVSRDGARLIYSSNYNLQAINGAPTEYGDAYLLTLGGGGGGRPQKRRLAAGLGAGAPNPNRLALYSADGTSQVLDMLPYGAGAWGVHVAGGQLDTAEAEAILTAPGPGPALGPQVRAFDESGAPITGVNFYSSGTLRYGANVGATDLDADGREEMVTGPGPGTVFGPHVRGFRRASGGGVATVPGLSFFAYQTLQYGARVAGGDLDGNARGEILAGPGPGATFGPNVRAFRYEGGRVAAMGSVNFFAFSTTGRGVNVAGGDVDGDGRAEIAAAPGPGQGLSSSFAGFRLAGSGVAEISGFSVRPFTTGYGGNPSIGPSDEADSPDELLACAGPSPAATSAVVVYKWNGASNQQSVAFTPFSGTVYGALPAAIQLP